MGAAPDGSSSRVTEVGLAATRTAFGGLIRRPAELVGAMLRPGPSSPYSGLIRPIPSQSCAGCPASSPAADAEPLGRHELERGERAVGRVRLHRR